MKILIVSSFLPYPLFSGGHVRLYNIIKQLAKKHELTLICEKRASQTEADILQLKQYCKKVITVPRKKQWTVSNILKSGTSSYSFLMTGHTSMVMQNKIQEELDKNKFDVIHIETFYIFQNLPKVTLPIVLVEHNVEYLVYKRYANSTPFPIRPLLIIDIAKMKYWEEQFWKKATRLVAVSEAEKSLMGREDVSVVPNGVDIQKFRIQNSEFRIYNKDKRILFIGDFKWIQNKDAIEWILKEIWPKIISNFQFPISNFKLKLWVVGRNIPESIKNLTNDPNVVFDENAPAETYEIFQKADILLAPIRVGGGTSFKILEAMASGVPVVTTPLGTEGIDAEHGKEVTVGNDAKELSYKTLMLLQNKKEYITIASNARKLIERKYSWPIIVETLELVYKSAIKEHGTKKYA